MNAPPVDPLLKPDALSGVRIAISASESPAAVIDPFAYILRGRNTESSPRRISKGWSRTLGFPGKSFVSISTEMSSLGVMVAA
jgi:hypothetical protein